MAGLFGTAIPLGSSPAAAPREDAGRSASGGGWTATAELADPWPEPHAARPALLVPAAALLAGVVLATPIMARRRRP